MLDSDELKTENGTMIENQKSVFSDRKNNKCFVNQYKNNDGDEWGESKVDVDYSRNNIEPFEEKSVFYFDKSVTDCELPEIIVCYKENSYHVVKDICIDEGVPSKDKFFFESTEDDKIIRTFPKPVKDDIAELIEENHNHIMDLSIEHNCSVKTDNLCDLMQTSEIGALEKEIITDCASKEKISLGEMFAMENLNPEKDNSMLPDIQMQKLTDSIEEMNNDAVLSEETDLSSEELNNGRNSNEESSHDTKANDTTISENFVSESVESSLDKDVCHNEKVETCPIDLCDQSCESNDLFTSEGKNSHGESSFSMAGGPISGLISYSGAIAYSGSLSHRSDSSTTSTRSFAFPVLPNEWNSSPVRMAKAERRRYRKHRGWKTIIIPCCRF